MSLRNSSSGTSTGPNGPGARSRAFALGVDVADVLVRDDADDLVALHRRQQRAQAAGRVRQRDGRADLVGEHGRGIGLELRVLDRVELLIAGAHRLVPRLGVVLGKLHAVEPVRIGDAEAPRREVGLVAARSRLVRRGDAAPVRAADARAVPEIHGEAAPQENALKAFAAVPAVLPRDGARAVPHQEVHGARLDGNLVFDDAVIAMQRRCGGVAERPCRRSRTRLAVVSGSPRRRCSAPSQPAASASEGQNERGQDARTGLFFFMRGSYRRKRGQIYFPRASLPEGQIYCAENRSVPCCGVSLPRRRPEVAVGAARPSRPGLGSRRAAREP